MIESREHELAERIGLDAHAHAPRVERRVEEAMLERLLR